MNFRCEIGPKIWDKFRISSEFIPVFVWSLSFRSEKRSNVNSGRAWPARHKCIVQCIYPWPFSNQAGAEPQSWLSIARSSCINQFLTVHLQSEN